MEATATELGQPIVLEGYEPPRDPRLNAFGRNFAVFLRDYDAALDDFERLIEVPNAELYAWVVGAEDAPQDFDTAVLRQLISFHAQSGGGR